MGVYDEWLPANEEMRFGYAEERRIIDARIRMSRRNRWRKRRIKMLRVWARLMRRRGYMKPSSSRASSDIMSIPHGGSQVRSTST